MKTEINIDNWVRKQHFLFFKDFEEPFYGVNVIIDCTRAYEKSKKRGCSFFLYYLYCSLKAANSIENFRYIIEGESVYLYDQIDASTTVDRPNGTFGMSDAISYSPSFEMFEEGALAEMERIRLSVDLLPASRNNIIHYSAVPWIDFTSLSHARKFSRKDSSTKISFGKMTEKSGKRFMPVSIHVHHALIDGVHIGLFVDEFQRLMNE